MELFLNFLAKYFHGDVLLVFLVSGTALLLEKKVFLKKGLAKEYKFSKYVGYLYIAGSLLLFFIARYI